MKKPRQYSTTRFSLLTATNNTRKTEERFINIGMSAANKILLVVHLEQEMTDELIIIRVISCRKAKALERRVYEKFMKKVKNKRLATATDDMLPEYDFRGMKSVRGEYYRAYRQGHTVRIYETDGTVSVRHFTLADGAVMLEPDVRVYFPNSDAVNKTLRSLIALVPAKSTRRRLTRSA